MKTDQTLTKTLTHHHSAGYYRKQPTVGLLLERFPGSEDGYLSQILKGVMATVQARGINLLCFTGGTLGHWPYNPFDRQRNILYELASPNNVAGLIILGTVGSYVTPEVLANFHTRYRPLPTVSIGTPLPAIPSIVVDNHQGLRQAILHLISHNYRRIAFICGPEEVPEAKLRYQVYTDVLAEYGYPVEPELVAPGNFSTYSGAAAIDLLLDQRRVRFDSVAAANDNMALGALESLLARGIDVPREIAIVGFDDIERGRVATPPLTTVRQPMFDLGKKGVDILLDQIAGENVPDLVTLPATLVVRQSCGCLNPVVAQVALQPKPAPDNPLVEWAKTIEAVSGIMADQADDLLNSFYADLNGEVPGAFLLTLDKILRQTLAGGRDISAWQGAISVLRPMLFGVEPAERLFRAETLLHQARTIIGDMAQRVQAWQLLQREEQNAMFREVSQALVTMVEVGDLMKTIGRKLPHLGIKCCYLLLYEPYQVSDSYPPWSRIMLAYHEQARFDLGSEGYRFPSNRLVPPDWLPQTRYTLVVEPLYFRENQLGFVLFEVGPPEGMIYEELRGQISSALQGALLVQQVQNHALTLEAEVTARTAELRQEIAKHEQTEAALRQSEATTKALLEAIPDLIFRVNGDGYNLDVLPSEIVSSVVPLDDVIGKHAFEVLPFELAQERMAGVKQALQTGQVQIHEYQIQIENETHFEEARIVLCGPDEVLIIIRDITERKLAAEKLKTYSEQLEELVKARTAELEEAQERLIRQEKLAFLGQLAGGVGHELRNPLGVITNAIYFLQMVLSEADETVKEYLDLIDNRVQEADKIVSDLLNLSRNRTADRTEVTARHLVEEVVTRQPAPDGVTLTVDLPLDLPALFVDPQQIRQVLVNLVANAYQAMPNGGILTISAHNEAEWVKLSVADTGMGMSAEVMMKSFEPLFTTKVKGIGLGLAVSKNLVEVNGGHLAVNSEEGQGSIFAIILPTSASDETVS